MVFCLPQTNAAAVRLPLKEGVRWWKLIQLGVSSTLQTVKLLLH